MNYIQIGKRIRKLRQQQGYTQEALAEAIDRSVPYVSHIERATKKGSLETIFRIATVLNVSIDYLLNGTNSSEASASMPEVEAIFKDCLTYEKQIILDIAEAVKRSLQDNRWAA